MKDEDFQVLLQGVKEMKAFERGEDVRAGVAKGERYACSVSTGTTFTDSSITK